MERSAGGSTVFCFVIFANGQVAASSTMITSHAVTSALPSETRISLETSPGTEDVEVNGHGECFIFVFKSESLMMEPQFFFVRYI